MSRRELDLGTPEKISLTLSPSLKVVVLKTLSIILSTLAPCQNNVYSS